jgi:hypothetical protein
MSYELALTEVAADDLLALLESLPAGRRADAINGVETALLNLAANPQLAQHQHLGRSTYRFQFLAGGVQYHWGATFCYSEDETHIQVTHVYRASAL